MCNRMKSKYSDIPSITSRNTYYRAVLTMILATTMVMDDEEDDVDDGDEMTT